MYHYPTSPPAGWSSFDYMNSPPTSPHYAYYATQFTNPFGSPRSTTKRHARKASYAAPPSKDAGWHSGYNNHGFYGAMPEFGTAKHENVSAFFGGIPPYYRRRKTMSGAHAGVFDYGDKPRPQSSRKRSIFVDVVDDGYDDVPRYAARGEPNKSRRRPSAAQRKPKPATDPFFSSSQVPPSATASAYNDAGDAAKRSRARRQSTSTRNPTMPSKPASSSKPPPKATEADTKREGIPAGYSTKNWDPTEAPIILLGSVFDANSLGKWIYDWTIFHHGASTPMADVAGDLWLLLIKLAGKVKRANECVDRIRDIESQEIVDDFLEGGERLWSRFKKLLRTCEQFMWKAAKREGKGSVSMGRNAGCEFVESIFGRERELENTEKLMNSIRLWNMRFDANCDEILRKRTV
ncbi:vegetative cell wall protein gp1 [Aspergillus californicus]